MGVTFECDHPPEARSRRIVSTSALPEGLAPGAIETLVRERVARGEDLYHSMGALADIGPDLIVTQDLCAVCAIDVSEVENALIHLGCQARVLTLDPMRLDEVIASVGTVGAVTGRDAAAADLMSSLRVRLGALAARLDGARRGPRYGHGCRGFRGPRPGRGALRGGDLGPGARLGARGGDRGPVRLSARGALGLAEGLVDGGAVPPGVEVWAVDAGAFVVRPGPRVVEGCEMLATILHPDRCGGPDLAKARRVA